MFSISLYEQYLTNSANCLSGKERTKKLNYEKERINELLSGLSTLYRDDKAIFDKKDHTIYTLIKRDIIRTAVEGGTDGAICLSQFLLRGLLSTIDSLQEKQEVA